MDREVLRFEWGLNKMLNKGDIIDIGIFVSDLVFKKIFEVSFNILLVWVFKVWIFWSL